MQFINNKNNLFQLLAQGATVITPNNRLSERLLQEYYHFCQLNTVDKPLCLPYRSLLIRSLQQWQELNPEHHTSISSSAPLAPSPHVWGEGKNEASALRGPVTLINSHQIHFLWKKIIQSSHEITYTDGLLNAIITAWEQVEQWNINPDDANFLHSNQTRQFQQWWKTFRQELNTLHGITEHQILPYLISYGFIFTTKPVIWCCFDAFTPQQLALQAYLDNSTLEQYEFDLSESRLGWQAQPTQLFAAEDEKEEYQQLMLWLNDKLIAGHRNIGVVIPELEQHAKPLQRLLQTRFNPNLFNISLGKKLSDFPLASHAMQWLQLNTKELAQEQLCLLLQSPYLGHAKTEFLARSQYLQDSVNLQHASNSFKKILIDLQQHAPKLANCLTQIQNYPKTASPQEWVILFQDRLNQLGFPGDYGLNSDNYQCFQRFTAIFDDFRQLSFLCSEISSQEAFATFKQLIETTIFQPKTTSACIQISGLLEAGGLEFECLWVMGLTDQCLPQKLQHSPFIPPRLRKELAMPHSTPIRELEFAKKMLERLQNSSQEIVFSYPKWQGDNPNLPCALIQDLSRLGCQAQDLSNEFTNQLISWEEDYILEFLSDEQISATTSLLANQAKCPFKAFADHRLQAKPNNDRVEGLDQKERGQLIHKVMELLWQDLGSYDRFISLSNTSLDECIDQAIQKALAPLQQTHAESLPSFLQNIEYNRLRRLVLSCLAWEKQRTPFTIAALEHTYSMSLADLEFKVRIDRLDEVGPKKWVVDYKTSLPPTKPWYEDRPKDPQLLFYSLLDENINTLLFLQLSNGTIQCSGLSEEKHHTPGITPLKKGHTWEEMQNHWREQLTSLAQEFKQGRCDPQPANISICNQCNFQSLCRI